MNITGTSGADSLVGLSGADSIMGLDGADSIMGDAGHDTLDGNEGDDFLWGGMGNDLLWGIDAGDDRLAGGNGEDTFFVMGGYDQVFLHAGDATDGVSDYIVLWNGDDFHVTVHGFDRSIDKLLLSNDLVSSVDMTALGSSYELPNGETGWEYSWDNGSYIRFVGFTSALTAADIA